MKPPMKKTAGWWALAIVAISVGIEWYLWDFDGALRWMTLLALASVVVYFFTSGRGAEDELWVFGMFRRLFAGGQTGGAGGVQPTDQSPPSSPVPEGETRDQPPIGTGPAAEPRWEDRLDPGLKTFT